MKLVTIPYDALPCSLKEFTINGIDAAKDDFGETIFESDGFYGCANNYFKGNTNLSHVKKVCDKYNISCEEYLEIVEQLEDVLYVGSCGWCV